MDDASEQPRRRTPPIPVWCSPAEREVILASAQEAGMSASSYLRRLGLGYAPRSMIDFEKVEAMLKVAADAGRMGGLLKMWLTDDKRMTAFDGRDMRPVILEVLRKIGEAQTEIRFIAEAVVKARA